MIYKWLNDYLYIYDIRFKIKFYYLEDNPKNHGIYEVNY